MDVLVDNTPKAKRANVEQQIRTYMDTLGLTMYKDRQPIAMGSSAQYVWTVLTDAIWGQDKFLLRDDGSAASRQSAARLTAWLRSFQPKSSIVWLTTCSEEALLQPIFQDSSACYLAYSSQFLKQMQGELVEVSYAELQAKLQALKSEEEARKAKQRAQWVASMSEQMKQGAELEKAEKFTEALALYDKLSEGGWPDAMVTAARLYYEEKGSEYLLDQWHKAERLCHKANTIEGWILMADRTMDRVKLYDIKTCTEEEKGYVIDHLQNAVVFYRYATEMGSTEACYKLAKLHLRYSFSRRVEENDRTISNLSYHHSDAIPYIKKLLAKMDAGESVGYELSSLRLTDKAFYQQAVEEYQAEKNQ